MPLPLLDRLPEDIVLHALEWLDWDAVARLAACSKEARQWLAFCIAPESVLDAFRCPECNKPHKVHCPPKPKLVLLDDMRFHSDVNFGQTATFQIPRFGDLMSQMNLVAGLRPLRFA